jgi:pimeloyl-ACP methyl ester carboxylesterase
VQIISARNSGFAGAVRKLGTEGADAKAGIARGLCLSSGGRSFAACPDASTVSARRRPPSTPPPPILHPRVLPLPDPAPDADLLRIPVGPGSVHVERYGHGGTPVVLLHGFATSSFLWRAVGPALATARCTAYAIDLFGYGESDRPFDAEFGIAAQADYVDRAMTALRLSSAFVVGVDLGGGVALRLAAARPERVDGLALVNSIGFDSVPGRDVRTLQRNTARFAFRVSRGMLGAAPLIGSVLAGGVADPARMPDRLVARYLAPYVGREGVSHLLALARSVVVDDLEEVDLRLLSAPTLVVSGEADQWVEPEVSRRLAATIPGARLVSLPGLARLVPEEAPAELARLIADFVAEQTGRGGAPLQRPAAAGAGDAPSAPPPPPSNRERSEGELV